jgi:hypothetical protein
MNSNASTLGNRREDGESSSRERVLGNETKEKRVFNISEKERERERAEKEREREREREMFDAISNQVGKRRETERWE